MKKLEAARVELEVLAEHAWARPITRTAHGICLTCDISKTMVRKQLDLCAKTDINQFSEGHVPAAAQSDCIVLVPSGEELRQRGLVKLYSGHPGSWRGRRHPGSRRGRFHAVAGEGVI